MSEKEIYPGQPMPFFVQPGEETLASPAYREALEALKATNPEVKTLTAVKEEIARKSYMNSGRKDDSDKVRTDLIPVEAMMAVAEVLTDGAKRYGERNWEKGLAYNRVYGAILRHLFAWWKGEELDHDSGMPHLWHALTGLCFLTTYEAREMKSFDNRKENE